MFLHIFRDHKEIIYKNKDLILILILIRVNIIRILNLQLLNTSS